MWEFISKLLLIWVGMELLWFAWKTYQHVRAEKRQQEIDHAMQIIAKELQTQYKIVYTETVDDTVLMYDSRTHGFVCQAPNDVQLWQQARALFPNKQFILKYTANSQLNYQFIK
jgi:hypothetical protein